MRPSLREAGHLVRLAVVVVVCVGVFLVLRAAVVPASFGVHGHYRAEALDDVRSRAPSFAGQAECIACHEDQHKAKAAGRHARINCEACHGPLAAHAAEPTSKPKIADVPALCINCHEKDSAKPKSLPQVISKQHSDGTPCEACHQPHAPKMQ